MATTSTATRRINLDDKYSAERGDIFLSGLQALVRLPLVQQRRDRAAGLNTAGFISGYRGSPLGGYDKLLWAAADELERHQITFQPGLNEDLAATAVWGSQQVGLFPAARYQGVFGLWYGKGPGVDRSGDALKHANLAGTSPHGGVLAVAGDDHACKSSSLPHQSEYAFMAAGIPVLNPAGVGELLHYGLHGWAMSRFSGCWVGLKALAEQMDASATLALDPDEPRIILPSDFAIPSDGLGIRRRDTPFAQEARLLEYKLAAAQAYVRANQLDTTTHDSAAAHLGIVTTGKSWLDLMQALDELGLDERKLRMIGMRVYKVAMTWPLEPTGLRAFARGLDEILVVEEKRGLVEDQLKDVLYDLPDGLRPRITGKRDEQGNWQLPATLELSPAQIARVVARRLRPYYVDADMERRLRQLNEREQDADRSNGGHVRVPHYCSGCPHSRSTRVPDGSRALAGIGCHYMAQWIQPRTETFTHMGAEGANWLGQAPFTDEPHVFQNLGGGTYFHSGILAIRAAVAAGVNMTYKLLWNDAVAMTGGQAVEGNPDIYRAVAQLRAEGVSRIELLSDESGQFDRGRLPAEIQPRDRSELETTQQQLRETTGVSVLIYVQSCATEKRRRRKRGMLPQAPRRVVINEAVCEGCGDCGRQSGCLSIVPKDTPWGRKRAIDQSSCNADYSCMDGFCPSFVSLRGAGLHSPERLDASVLGPLPEPKLPSLERPWRILIPGIGGTGVVTTSALLGMAAHIDGLASRTLDQAGLAQKFGAVTSHVQIAAQCSQLHAPRVSVGQADLVIAADLMVATGRDALLGMDPTRTSAVVNHHESVTGAFTQDGDKGVPVSLLERRLGESVRILYTLDVNRLTEALMGDTAASNVFLLGIAWQLGLIPISRKALEEAIRLNATAVERNLAAFHWGRQAAQRPAEVMATAGLKENPGGDEGLDERLRRHRDHLLAYQNDALADRHARVVDRARRLEQQLVPGSEAFTIAVAEGYLHLLAVKDEYEVARQLSRPAFIADLRRQFSGGKLEFHLAPPLISRRDPATGRPRKRTFGAWLLPVLRLVAAGSRLRNSWLDPFRYSTDRRLDRRLLATYEQWLERLFAQTTTDTLPIATTIAALPRTIRGFGPVREAAADSALREAELLWRRFEQPCRPQVIDANTGGKVVRFIARTG